MRGPPDRSLRRVGEPAEANFITGSQDSRERRAARKDFQAAADTWVPFSVALSSVIDRLARNYKREEAA